MIDPERVACCNTDARTFRYRETRFFLGVIPYVSENKPPLTRTATQERLENRKKVTEGKIISFDQHGRVGIVRAEDGTEAAFWHYELNEIRAPLSAV
ncbi:hypothetical protein [Neptuniibacter sp. QD37_11]|uniref:hypothetical protein n=1 Tax=Neptuniibacter sp. QD37_11 TaxID=3398209 RepID=UPI0039F591C2